MDRVSKLRISIAVLILTVAVFLAGDAMIRAQEKDSAQDKDFYALQGKVEVNSALIDQILKHDADVDAEIKDNQQVNRDILTRISHIEGGASAVIALFGLYIGLPYLPDKWKRKNP